MMIRLTVIALATGLLAGCDDKVEVPDIPFAPLADRTVSDPDNPRKTFRVDFARIEQNFPLARTDLANITPKNLAAMSQEQVDQIYGRLTAGPIPDGIYQGDLFFRRSDNLESEETLVTRLGEILGGIRGEIADLKVKKVELLGKALWKGKRFYRDERMLRNMIEDLKVLEPLLGDESTENIATATVDRRSLLRFFLPKTEVWLLFPAKLHCGQSLVDSRRESIIIDYAYADELPGYREHPDSLAGRKGLRIRDEIRMVRPGFYLGRAYVNRMFLLNFTLYNPEVAERHGEAFAQGADLAEDCWVGEQVRQAAVP